jgi:hypothetical protein
MQPMPGAGRRWGFGQRCWSFGYKRTCTIEGDYKNWIDSIYIINRANKRVPAGFQVIDAIAGQKEFIRDRRSRINGPRKK